ncbi:MAG: ABC transporter ATP-binding protein, partial [Thermaerobacterales bacterium]
MLSIWRLLGYMRPYLKYFSIGMICMFLTVVGDMVVPRLIGWIIDHVIEAGQAHLLLPYTLSVLGVAVAKAAAIYGQRYSLATLTQKVIYDIRGGLYNHLQSLPFGFYDRSRTGELMSRVTQDVEILRRFFSNAMGSIVMNVVSFVMVLVILVSIHAPLTLVALGPSPLLLAAIYWFSKLVRPRFRIIQQKQAALTSNIQENVTGVRVVRAFAREDHEIEKFRDVNWDYMQENVQAVRLWSFYFPMMNFITALGLAAVIWYGGLEVARG